MINIGKEKWGPFAWHMLHSFSIKSPNIRKKHSYYVFYTTFIYIIPCLVCKEHYSEILYNMLPLYEEKINREYIEKWVFLTHNIVNIILKKKLYTFKKCIEENRKPRNKDIFFFMKAVYNSFNYDNMCFYNFDQIYNFFILFCNLYPSKKIRVILKSYIDDQNFKDISTPKELQRWFLTNKDIWISPS